jgi:hypothetical protein
MTLSTYRTSHNSSNSKLVTALKYKYNKDSVVILFNGFEGILQAKYQDSTLESANITSTTEVRRLAILVLLMTGN